FASSLAATITFWFSKNFFKDFVQKYFLKQVTFVQSGIEKEGVFYLLTLRLVPLFPYFLVNVLAGVTKMKIKKFYLISQIGMLPANIIYVNAGMQLAKVETYSELFSAQLLFSILVIALLPLIGRLLLIVKNKYKSTHTLP
ncbi:MAG: VTT domain-containing protein, partial [Silvanigrellaceae bacterium]|nr:VTT domain-containing protein [Silvanigrellaceae bacterium]